MTETVTLIRRHSGTLVLGCATAYAADARDSHQILARPDAAGVWLWCRYCHARHQTGGCRGSEHCVSWPQMLQVMEQFLGASEFRRLLWLAGRVADERDE